MYSTAHKRTERRQRAPRPKRRNGHPVLCARVRCCVGQQGRAMPISLNTPGYVYLWWKTGVQRPCPFNEYLEHKMPFGAYCSGNGECKSGGVLAGTSGCQIRKPGFKCGVAYCSRRRDVYSNPGQLVSKMVGGECNRLDMGFSSAAWVSHFLMPIESSHVNRRVR